MYGPCQHTVVGRVWWVKRPPCSLLEKIRFRRTAVSKRAHEKKSYNCSSRNCSNILHVQTQNCWQKFSHVLRDCHVKLSSQEIKAYHTGVRRDFISLKLEVKIFATQCKYKQTAGDAHSLFLYASPCERGSAASPMRRAQECTATCVAHTVDVWPMPAHSTPFKRPLAKGPRTTDGHACNRNMT